jgi:hypothetical protein
LLAPAWLAFRKRGGSQATKSGGIGISLLYTGTDGELGDTEENWKRRALGLSVQHDLIPMILIHDGATS